MVVNDISCFFYRFCFSIAATNINDAQRTGMPPGHQYLDYFSGYSSKC